MFLITWMGARLTFCGKTPVINLIQVTVLKTNLEEKKKKMGMVTGTKNLGSSYM